MESKSFFSTESNTLDNLGFLNKLNNNNKTYVLSHETKNNKENLLIKNSSRPLNWLNLGEGKTIKFNK